MRRSTISAPPARELFVAAEALRDGPLREDHEALGLLRERQPASVRVCAFLDKRARRRVPFEADYVGFAIPDRFVVGYGLDFNENYRFLPDVCMLKDIA